MILWGFVVLAGLVGFVAWRVYFARTQPDSSSAQSIDEQARKGNTAWLPTDVEAPSHSLSDAGSEASSSTELGADGGGGGSSGSE